MLRSFIKLSLRKLWLDKSFSLLSIVGLSLATAAAVVLLLYVRYEKSYDNFRDDSIYRVTYHGFQHDQETSQAAQIIPALAPAIKNEIPEIELAVRFAHTGPFMADPVMQYGNKYFRESKIYFADKDFVPLFSYELIAGSATKALAEPNQVIISKSMQQKYFGNADALGKIITFHQGDPGTKDLIVTGVFEDVPSNSHFHTDFVVSFATLGFNLDQDWDWGNFYTYIKIREGSDSQTVQGKIPAMLDKYVGKMIAQLVSEGYRLEFQLQPIHDIHLQSRLWGELEPNGDDRTVSFLQIIAIMIMTIAWINYINFSIAKSSENTRSISIRKITGSTRGQLIFQLLTDATAINVMATILALAMIQIVLPLLKQTIGLPAQLTLDVSGALLLGILCTGGIILSGLYPAIFISNFNPIALLRSKISRSTASLHVNKALIVFQFATSIILIVGTIAVFKQLNFMRSQDLGINIDQVLIVKGPAVKDSTYQSTLHAFSNEISKMPYVNAFTVSSSIPGEELHWGRDFYVESSAQNDVDAMIVAVDEKFFTTYGATFAAGTNFPDGSTAYRDHIIVNEAMAREFGFAESEKLIGKTVFWSENSQRLPKKVIGVVKDFNQQSLHRKVEPIIYTLKKYVFAPWAGEFYSFRIKASEAATTIAALEKQWKETYADNPFDYFFLDDYYNAQYKADDQFGKVFMVFSALAIFIACLGLFGLTAYMVAMRTKEIGIRKVLGSSSLELVTLLSRNYVMLVIIAVVIGCPVSYYLVQEWQSQFAYKAPITISIFVGASMMAIIMALLTVGIKSWRASMLDPANALKYE